MQFQGVRTFLLVSLLVLSSLPSAVAQTTSAPVSDEISAAYERATFVLNLNPVVWDQLRSDVAIIADRLRRVDPQAADELTASLDHVIAATTRPPPPIPDDDIPVNPEAEESDRLPRAEAARQVFERLTRAVCSIVLHDLGALSTSNLKSAELKTLRDEFAAFEGTLRVADPQAHDRLILKIRELNELVVSSDGKPRPDSAQKQVSSIRDEIAEYVSHNFGAGFIATSDRPLAPWPLASPTSDRGARLPIRLPPGSRISKSLPRPRQILNSVERGALERETPLITLGAAAFNNPFIFGEPARTLGISCNSCHNKSGINSNFFIPGLSARPGGVDVTNGFFAPHANNAVFDPLDIPDLRGIRFTAPYGRNGRFASLRDFVRNVIVNEFNGQEPDPLLLDGMVLYMNEFDFVRNPALNRDGTLNKRASEEARRGEKLFARPFAQFGNVSCATCHVPSANFIDHQRHDIGTVHGYEDFSRDRALDTPTLLGTVFSAPYFHDGSQPTLRGVVEWFDREYKLKLSAQERSDLIAFVYTVGNGIHAFQVGDSFLAEDLEDQEAFLATFEFLAEKEKWTVIAELFQGIGRELREQKKTLKSPSLAPTLTEMAQLMDESAADVVAGRREAVVAKVREWRKLYEGNRFDFEYPPSEVTPSSQATYPQASPAKK